MSKKESPLLPSVLIQELEDIENSKERQYEVKTQKIRQMILATLGEKEETPRVSVTHNGTNYELFLKGDKDKETLSMEIMPLDPEGSQTYHLYQIVGSEFSDGEDADIIDRYLEATDFLVEKLASQESQVAGIARE